MNSYLNSVNYLYDLQKFGIKLGLKNILSILKHLDNPHEHVRTVHIAGTNGKGSIAAMLSSILIKAGYKVGLYTSPHLVSFRERIKLNEKPISKIEVIRLVEEIKTKIDTHTSPTFFEFTTAMAMLHFAKSSVDIAILETGMGGRLDATNVVTPLVTIISNVSLEHKDYLGNTLKAITNEKAGIIKRGIEVITAERKPNVLAVIKGCCKKNSSPLFRVGEDIRKRRVNNKNNRFHYLGMDRQLFNLEVGLKGEHQVVNGVTALGAVEILIRKGYEVPESAIYQGLKEVNWPGRLEVIGENPTVVLDGAHNPVAATCLRQALLNEFSFHSLILVMGIMRDKDIKGMFKRLIPIADKVILTKPAYERAADPHYLYELGAFYQKDMIINQSVDEAVKLALSMAHEHDLICITGSLYTVGEARKYLIRLKVRNRWN
ncbi:MAG TPA: bifunctional folylpolyglutamate synthase/dihydrofolate synthase [Syntrophaceae bacterium]|nr:bifunctional folylpolyglutamate synthase/dihydrofolate synthase [Syntrophaceae bacterium]